MCGLTGFLHAGTTSSDYLHGVVQRMTDRLVHRGPDADGIWVGDGIALGHRRLSILDLSPAGAQPMLSGCGRWVLAFNGEIYNHLDLREELASQSAVPSWRGHSDTETLLAGFAHWGVEVTLKKAQGMFAIALWDRQTRQLSLARDRMGEKPLYWGWSGRSFVFGSELKALRAHPEFVGGVCPQAASLYLRFSYVPAPYSIHPNIYKLEPGTILQLQGDPPASPPSQLLRPGQQHGGLSIRRYWCLQQVLQHGLEHPLQDADEAIQQLEDTLSHAVKQQMLADVPLGAFLSGGVDSSTIVALMRQHSRLPVRTFTIGFDDARYDESAHAQAVAAHLGTQHSMLRVTDRDALAVIPQLSTLYDEPFADSSQIPTYLVCKAAHAQVTVALSGDAGDELFGGYNRYFWGERIWSRVSWLPAPLRYLLGKGLQAMPVSGWDALSGMPARLGGAAIAQAGDKAHKLGARLKTVQDMESLYRSLVTEWPTPPLAQPSRQMPVSLLDDHLPSYGPRESAARMMAQDLRTYLPDDILCKVDRAAMGVSLETRVPFLDPAVIELAARIPLSLKIRNGQGKWPLRQVLYRHVSPALIDRPKMGFGIPIGAWLRGPLRDWAEALLSVTSLRQGGLLDEAVIRATWLEHLSGRREHATKLWSVLMLQAWMQSSS